MLSSYDTRPTNVMPSNHFIMWLDRCSQPIFFFVKQWQSNDAIKRRRQLTLVELGVGSNNIHSIHFKLKWQRQRENRTMSFKIEMTNTKWKHKLVSTRMLRLPLASSCDGRLCTIPVQQSMLECPLPIQFGVLECSVLFTSMNAAISQSQCNQSTYDMRKDNDFISNECHITAKNMSLRSVITFNLFPHEQWHNLSAPNN